MAQFDLKAVISAKDNASGTISKVGGAFNTLAKVGIAGAVAGVVGLTAGLVASVNEFKEAQRGIAQTDAVLKSTGGAAGVTAEQVTKLADSLSMASLFTDDMVRSAENELLTFTSVGKDVFPRATQAIVDMATALNLDLSSATKMVGKALQDPIKGITALRKVGVNFTEEQQDMVKAMVEVGDVAGAQAYILKELETEYGGSGLAAANTFEGSIHRLSQATDNLKETLGKTIVDAITPFVTKLANWAASDQAQAKIEALSQKIGELMQKGVEWTTQVAIPWVQQHWPAIKDAVLKTVDAIKSIINWMLQNKLMVGQLILGIGILAFSFNPLQAILLIIIGVIISVIGVIDRLKDGIRQMVDGSRYNMELARNIFNDAKDFIVNTFNDIYNGARGLADRIGGALSGGFWSAYDSVKSALNSIIGLLNGYIRLYNTIPFLGDIGELGYLAKGGYAEAGSPYIVGERGPELFIPNSSGRVVPNNQISNSATVNFYGNITNTSNASLDAIGQRIARQIQLSSQGI